MQLGQFALQQDVVMVGARNVAGPAGAGAAVIQYLVHGGDHFGILAHAEIVVTAPDDDVLDTVHGVPRGFGKLIDAAITDCRGTRRGRCTVPARHREG